MRPLHCSAALQWVHDAAQGAQAAHDHRPACQRSTRLRIMSLAVMLKTLPSRCEAKYSKTWQGKKHVQRLLPGWGACLVV